MSDPLNSIEFTAQVTLQDTAASVLSGDLQVLATPQLVAWMERASVQACDILLGPGQTTVGTEVHIEHTAPSAIGQIIHVSAALVGQNGKRLMLELAAWDEAGLVATASHTRYIVDSERFMARVQARQTSALV